MYKGALTIPGFTFTNFVAGSEARLSVWVCSLYVGMHFISSMYAEVLGLRAAQFWKCFFLLIVGGQRAFLWQNIIDLTLGSNMFSISVCCIFPSSSNWVGEICRLDILLIYFDLSCRLCSKSDDWSRLTFTLVRWYLALKSNVFEQIWVTLQWMSLSCLFAVNKMVCCFQWNRCRFGLERTGTASEFMTLGHVHNTSGNSVCLTFRWCGLLIPDFAATYSDWPLSHCMAPCEKRNKSNVAKKSSEPKGYISHVHFGLCVCSILYLSTWIQQLLALLFKIL